MNHLLDISMAVGPVLGYVHQYYIIQRSKSVGTFSIDICGILLFANILRLNFYIFEKYQLALFFQSLIMIFAQICLVHICTKYRHKNNEVKSQSSSESSFDTGKSQNLDNFWRWNLFSTYFLFIIFFTFITFSVTIVFYQLQMNRYGVMIGLVALLSESILILPQLLKNCQNQSTKGLSYVLVSLNLFGDIFKLVYFIIQFQPFQFVLCGVIQVILDTFVIIQIFWYRRAKFNDEDKQRRSLSPKYSIVHEMKPETEKNLDEVQMKNMPQFSIEAQQIFNFQPIDGFVIQSEENSPTHMKKSQSNNPQRSKVNNLSEQKIEGEINEDKVVEIQSKDLFVKADKNSILQTNPSIVLEVKKVLSDQPLPNSSQTQFFKINFTHATKSLDNIEVQC